MVQTKVQTYGPAAIAAATELSHVFGSDGKLVYRGYDIADLVDRYDSSPFAKRHATA